VDADGDEESLNLPSNAVALLLISEGSTDQEGCSAKFTHEAVLGDQKEVQ
jgi:hypothetical protein